MKDHTKACLALAAKTAIENLEKAPASLVNATNMEEAIENMWETVADVYNHGEIVCFCCCAKN